MWGSGFLVENTCAVTYSVAMRKLFIFVVVASFVVCPSQTNAAVKAGASCKKVGSISVVGAKKYTCIKSGKKLVWNKGVAIATRTPTPTATQISGGLWGKYNLTKPISADAVIKVATENYKVYTAKTRSDQEVKVIAQTGVDQQLVTWIQEGAVYVAQRFAYPKLSRSFVDVIAFDVLWLEETYKKEGFSSDQVRDRIGGFNAGSPAFGGSYSNTWNYATIMKNNSLVNNRAGIAQTAGHEFFHAIQENLAGQLANATGDRVPNWYWEGPAMFVGLQTAGILNHADYLAIGRPSMINRYNNGHPFNKSSNLSEIKANDQISDPYALGFAATEFLVSQVGVQKMVDVYAALGTGKNFSDAFKQGTGIELVDFYSMFDEIRGTIGFGKS